MTDPERTLLLCTTGTPGGLPALTYGVWLAGRLNLPVTVLGIVENEARTAAVERALQAVQAQLEAAGIVHDVRLCTGAGCQVISAEAAPGHHLVVMGSLGGPRWRDWLQGPSARRLLPDLKVPLLFAPRAHCQMDRILVCTGALEHATSAESWAVQLARRTNAALTVLHVAQTVFYHYPTSIEIETHGRDLLKADVPQARHLRALMEHAEALGVKAMLKIQPGTVVHEIIAQARRGQHDLVVMGSKHSSHSLRSRSLPDVTAEVMEALDVPVLAVKADHVCTLPD